MRRLTVASDGSIAECADIWRVVVLIQARLAIRASKRLRKQISANGAKSGTRVRLNLQREKRNLVANAGTVDLHHLSGVVGTLTSPVWFTRACKNMAEVMRKHQAKGWRRKISDTVVAAG